jgi:carboxypeptidase C (cathepsin A)
MTSVVMGRLFFYAQATIVSNVFQFGFGTSNQQQHDGNNDVVQTPEVPVVVGNDDPSTKDSDRITNLPGLDFDPNFEQYSGYLTVHEKHQRNIFYWYVESQGSPDEDPVVLWTNGGPGCSGFYGFGTEHGPFFISADGILSENPFSWNQVANILYIEQPAGVGFSYSEHKHDYQTGDDQAAADNYLVIRRFLERFPERQSNDFYIASESYGGHYMPQRKYSRRFVSDRCTYSCRDISSYRSIDSIFFFNDTVTNEILTRNEDGLINFKGMMVGNPYVDPYTNTITQFETWYQHGLVPWPLYKKYVDHCNDRKTYLNGVSKRQCQRLCPTISCSSLLTIFPPLQRCQNYMEQMYQELGKGINPYGLDFPRCLEAKRTHHRRIQKKKTTEESTMTTDTSSQSSQQTQVVFSSQITQLMNHTSAAFSHAMGNPPFLPPQDHYRPCAEEHLDDYLNRLDVVQAIHANPETLPWTSCSSRVHYSRQDTLTSMVDLYKELVHTIDGRDTNLKLLVYSGDDDSVCSLAGTQAWIWDLGVKAKGQYTWQPWKVKNQTAGFVTRFHLNNPHSSFVFVTVHGAGHEVPSYRPMEGLEVLKNYLSGKW